MKAIVQYKLTKKTETAASAGLKYFPNTIDSTIQRWKEESITVSKGRYLVQDGVPTCEEGVRLLERKIGNGT